MNECHLPSSVVLLLLITEDHNQVGNHPCCLLRTLCDRGGWLTKVNLPWVLYSTQAPKL